MLFLFLVFFLSASIFPSADAQSECGGERTCRPFFSVKGFICDCGFPKIYKDGKCVIDAGYSPFGGVLLLENEWKAKYTDVMSVEYIEISTAISAMFEVAFKNSFIYLSAIVEDLSTGTSKVGIQFNVNIEASVSVDEYVTLVKSSLGGSPVATLPGLVELKMNLNSLVISKTLLTCSKVNTCTSGPDSLGLCIDDPVLGPTCTCSPGFEDKNGICVDINECANPKACLVNGATCSNLVGSFVCACPGGLLSTPFGCIDFKPNADPCTDVAVKAAALGLGASCRKALNEKGYIFGCDFPLVAPQTADGTACIPVTSSKLKAASYQFDLAGIKWSDALKDSLSLEYLQVVHNVQLLVDTTLKVPGCSCSNKNSLDTSLANVLKVVNTENDKVSVVVELQKDDSTVVDKIISATVPSVGITVTKVKKIQDLSLVVSATACGKDTCDADSSCTSVASLTGFACACPFPRVRDSSGKCSLDEGRKPTAGQIVLANPWSDSLLDASSEASILLRTSVYSLFESFFTSVEPTFSAADVSFTITKDSSSTGISIKFLYTISQTITETSVISSITDLFGKTDGASYVSLVDLKLKMTTLTSGPKLLKCADVDLCSTAGDKFALCTDDAEKGPVCACSSGFEAKNGICVDIDECSNPLPCLIADATCTNTPGSFDCVCPAGYVSSPAGCLAVSPTSDPCSASSAVQKCLGFGASCFKNLSPDGFSCQCAFPLVPSKTDDSCVLFESTGLIAATYDLTLSGVTMSAKLKDVLSVEYLQLQAQVSTLLNTVLKEPGCPCSSDGPLDKSVGTLVSVAEVDTAVTVTTQVFLSNLEVIDLLKNAAVPGVDITVTAVKQKSIDKIVVQSDACSTPTAKAECGERLCLPAANLVGYVCDCEVPKVFLDGKCTIGKFFFSQ